MMAQGHLDPLTTLPTETLISIIGNLNLEDVENLANVSEPLSKICQSNPVWEKLYDNHLGTQNLSDEMKQIAEDMGWKKFYFSRKINTRRAAKKTTRQKSLAAISRENSLNEISRNVEEMRLKN